jgi:heme-degrading monooxygenase HmoA
MTGAHGVAEAIDLASRRRRPRGKLGGCVTCYSGAVALIAVISEVWPYPERRADYFRLSEELRPHLEAIEGFISVERFESSAEPGKFVSLSFWRDEESLSSWRNLEEHRIVMEKGRRGILRDYHIRVTSVLWDYSLTDRSQAPQDSRERLG